MRPNRPGLLAVLLSVITLTGCAVWPYEEKHIIAIRPATPKSATEQLVQLDQGWAQWALLKPCYAGPDVLKIPTSINYFVQRPGDSRIAVKSLGFLPDLPSSPPGKQDLWSCGYNWDVRPVIGTNLWLALDHHHSSHQPALNGTNRFDSDVLMKIYIFNPDQSVLQRELEAYAPWHHNDTILDWRFDESNQRLTYFTTNGYATFDLLQNRITLSPPPSGQPARTINDYGGHPSLWTPGWEPPR